MNRLTPLRIFRETLKTNIRPIRWNTNRVGDNPQAHYSGH